MDDHSAETGVQIKKVGKKIICSFNCDNFIRA